MNVLEARLPLARARRFPDFLDLTKPRITLLILVTALLGFYLGAGRALTLAALPLLLGTALISSGTSGLNQYLERDVDSRMSRTANRPLPSGRLRPAEALVFSLLLSLLGWVVLAVLVNALTGALAAATTLVYAFVYTPLKRVTSLAILVGAVPGALPAVGGWAAATGRIDTGAMVLFTIVFLWQLPHFLAIAWLYQEDYRRGGLWILPGFRHDGQGLARWVVFYNTALLPVSLLPVMVGMGGRLYLVGSLVLGLAFLATGLQFARTRSRFCARRHLLASVVYLPLLWGLLVIDQVGP
ncbi:MAG: heme o synthase [Acidobacteriota bacterium]